MSYEPALEAEKAVSAKLYQHSDGRLDLPTNEYDCCAEEAIKAFTTYLQSHPEELQRFCDAVLERIELKPNRLNMIDLAGLYRIPNSGGRSSE